MKVLVVYHLHQYPVRTTIQEHLRSFERYSTHHCYYLNVAAPIPRSARLFEPDVIIYHTSFISDRTAPEHFEALEDRVSFLRDASAVKLLIPQDEYVRTDVLAGFINTHRVGHVFSCAQSHEWRKIYSEVDPCLGVQFHTVLTGYLSDENIKRIRARSQVVTERDLDIGYRAWYPWPSLGRHAQLKGLVGTVFRERANAAGLRTDISNDLADTILGDGWFDFLLRAKYTIGVEGGASLLDRDGSLTECTKAYLAEHPNASFEEVEVACFPGLDGDLEYFAISPRHLECCATRTCQVLVEGEYNGVLTAGVHYIPVRRDLSDVDEAIEAIRRDDLREGIVERAYADVVLSGKWTYAGFVQLVFAAAVVDLPDKTVSIRSRSLVMRGRVWDHYCWTKRAMKYRVRQFGVTLLGEVGVLRLMSGLRRVVGRGRGV